MPARRYGSARRELSTAEETYLMIGPGVVCPFADERDAERTYWQHRERVLNLGNYRDHRAPGRRPWAFWCFEAKYDPDTGPRTVEGWREEERNQLRWLVEHDQLPSAERAALLEWAQSGRGCELRDEILALVAPIGH